MRIEAYHYAAAAKDLERSASLLELIHPDMDGGFQLARWLKWAKKLPDEIIRFRQVLCVEYVWALLDCGELESCESRLQGAERCLDADNKDKMVVVDETQFQSLRASITGARAYIAQVQGDIPGTVKYAQQALKLIPEDDYLRHGMIGGILGLSYWSDGDLEKAHQTFAKCMENLKWSGNITFAISTTIALAGVRIAQGYLRKALCEYEKSLQLAAEQEASVPVITTDLYLGLCMISYEQGDLETALQNLQRSQEKGDQAALPDWRYRWYLTKAKIELGQGNTDGALEKLQEAERIYFRNPLPDVSPVAALKTRVWLKQGRLNESRDWVTSQKLSVKDELSYLREFEHITLARVLLAEHAITLENNTLQAALSFLKRLLKAAEKSHRMASVIEILILQALANELQGNTSEALIALESALTLAEPEGYVRIFIDEGAPMVHLLSRISPKETIIKYINKMLSFSKAMPSNHTSAVNASLASIPVSQPLVEPLSQRELEVLHLIAQGLSNQEICQRLFLALSTVKGHNRNIFGKLQVERRTEPVARAQELGLLNQVLNP